jgi:hypothetical protein
LIRSTWGHGNISIKLVSDLPVGASKRDEARRAAGYLSKYVSKTFDAPRLFGRHRYDVGQGFQPPVQRLTGRTADEVLDQACEAMGSGLSASGHPLRQRTGTVRRRCGSHGPKRCAGRPTTGLGAGIDQAVHLAHGGEGLVLLADVRPKSVSLTGHGEQVLHGGDIEDREGQPGLTPHTVSDLMADDLDEAPSTTLAAYDSPLGTAILLGVGTVCFVAYRLMLRIGRLPQDVRVLQ